MRAGACAAQQTLSPEAASVLKHSLSLARRRGHAQLTPLHVAATLLSSRASLLRRACLKSQPHQPSHPLQCRALELCFNVALNRLPAAPGPLLHAQPSLSNALVAALKRAQAHQRRGCIEQQQQQQQPIIAIKVELEQLILSILDDPSVSRVMREAGFSSTSVKNNLEDCNTVSSVFQCYNSSGGIYSTPSSPPAENQRNIINPNSFWHSHLLSYASEQNPYFFSPPKKPVITCMNDSSYLKEDIKVVLEVLVGKKRRNTVVVGDSLSVAEGLVSELMGRIERGDVPDELKSANFVKFQFSSVPLMYMKREEVDMNVADLKRKVESVASGGRVIIYIGDLKWAVERDGDEREGVYGPVDHLIAEIGKLISWYNSSNMRVWLMATANYQTYMKCQMKQPPLEVQWALQAVSVPSSGLGLSLNATSGRDSRITLSENSSPVADKKFLSLKEESDVLSCCPECISNYEREAASAQLPYWLKPHGNGTLDKEDLHQLRRKYNKRCQSLHQGSQNPQNSSSIISNLGRNYYNASPYPFWANKNNIFSDSETISFAHPAVKLNQGASTPPRFRRQQSCHIEFSFRDGSSENRVDEPKLDSLKSMEDKEARITLALGNSMYTEAQRREKFAAGADLCGLLQENVPWQSESIPSIMEALMDSEAINQDKFILIQGNDIIGKRRLALAIAESMFGSSDSLFRMNMRNNENTASENREMLERALRNHDKLVLLVEDVDFADPEFAKFLADGFEAGKLETWGRNKADSGRAICILTTDGDTGCNITSREDVNSVIQMKLVVHESTLGSKMPNPDHKRKAEWDFPARSKTPRNNEMEEVSSNAIKNGKRAFERQLSANSLDLNIKADDDEAGEGKPGELSPISSDLTRETTVEQHNSLSFLKKIKNCFVFSRSSDQDGEARSMFASKIRRSFQEASGCNGVSNFNVDEGVLDEVLQGAGYTNGSFEKWLKDIFQTSLRAVNTGEREKVSFRLGLVGKGGSCAKDGFMGTCLPKKIPVSFMG